MIRSWPDWFLAIVVIVAAVAAAWLLIMVASGQAQHPALTKTQYDDRLAQLDREAIERAYVDHVVKLFGIWTTDYSDAPPKAIRGAMNARSAYVRAMNEIERREKELRP